MTLSLDAANAIKRIAMTRCEMDPDAAAGIAFHCDQDAASYRERTQRFGAWTDRRTVRDEMQRLRQAVRLSDTSQELIWLSAWKQWGEHPKTALWSDDRSPWDPSAVLFNIGGWADQVLKWIEEATPERGGRPEPIQARQLIRGIAATFTRFTGKQCTATPGTPFYEITREVLSSLQLPCKGPRKLIHAALTNPTGARDKVL
jgi:hypothetical protein